MFDIYEIHVPIDLANGCTAQIFVKCVLQNIKFTTMDIATNPPIQNLLELVSIVINIG